MNNDKSIYACYEEIKRREISELKEKLKAFGGVAHFGPDYQGEGATGFDMPIILINDDTGPHDAYVHGVSIDDEGHLNILAREEACDYASEIDLDDIAYGNIVFLADYIPTRTFKKDSFCISRLSREDLDSIGFDTSDIDDSTMERIADKLGDDYHSQLFWTSLEIIAEDCFEIPRKN